MCMWWASTYILTVLFSEPNILIITFFIVCFILTCAAVYLMIIDFKTHFKIILLTKILWETPIDTPTVVSKIVKQAKSLGTFFEIQFCHN